MRRLFGLVLGVILSAGLAPGVLAGSPAIFRDASSFSGTSFGWSSACGFEILLTEATRIVIVDRGDAGYDIHYDVRRTLTGPGGSVDVVGAYSYGAEQPVESFVDSQTGLYTEIYRETYRGTLTIRSGSIEFQVAGYLFSTLTVAYPDEGEPIITVENLVVHGTQPNDAWGLSSSDVSAICALLA